MRRGGIVAETNYKQNETLSKWIERQTGRHPENDMPAAVLARPGVGKTAFLIQLALDELLEGGEVLHVALGSNLTRVEARYDELLAERLQTRDSAEREQIQVETGRRRAIQAMLDGDLTADRLSAILKSYHQHLGLNPGLVLIDGADLSQLADRFAAMAEATERYGARLWLSFNIHRDQSGANLGRIPNQIAAGFYPVILLLPQGELIRAQLLAADAEKKGEQLDLDPGTLAPVSGGGKAVRRAAEFTLLSGAADGAELAFGECAERHGLAERNFSFAGRQTSRQRGLVVLEPGELALGDVSFAYLRARMKRDFEPSQRFRKVLQSIWHQVNPAGEVFCVGVVQKGGTVKGGTGWAVELAKKQNKPIWVYDQQLNTWYEWFGHDWRACDPPLISHYRFCGTGTRHLTEHGREAIEELFARSFG